MNQFGQAGTPGGARFVAAVFGFVFAGIGLTVIAFLWGAPFGDWDSPPLFFRIFGSLIAVAFVAMGGTMGVAALRNKLTPMARGAVPGQPGGRGTPGPLAEGGTAANGSYRCPNCAATLGSGTDVSPSGDVKCAFCGRWFNIHRAA